MQFTYKTVDGEIGQKLDKYFHLEKSFIKIEPGYCVAPKKFSEFGEKIRSFNVRKADTWIISYPRTG